MGPITPTWTGSEWEYIATYTVPPALTSIANSGDVYRVVVATTSANLSDDSCRFTDSGPFITLQVIECGIPLSAQLLSFSGRLVNERAALKWTTTGEDEPLQFEVEKSTDGINFFLIGTVNSYNDYASEQSTYTYTDPTPLAGKVYYRIKMKNAAGQSTYSRTIQLSIDPSPLSFLSVINPFGNELSFEISTEHNGKAEVDLIDAAGKTVRKTSFEVSSGVNRLSIENTDLLSVGIYFLRVNVAGNIIQKRVIKQNR